MDLEEALEKMEVMNQPAQRSYWGVRGWAKLRLSRRDIPRVQEIQEL